MAEIMSFETECHLEIIRMELLDFVPDLKKAIEDRKEEHELSLEETGGC